MSDLKTLLGAVGDYLPEVPSVPDQSTGTSTLEATPPKPLTMDIGAEADDFKQAIVDPVMAKVRDFNETAPIGIGKALSGVGKYSPTTEYIGRKAAGKVGVVKQPEDAMSQEAISAGRSGVADIVNALANASTSGEGVRGAAQSKMDMQQAASVGDTALENGVLLPFYTLGGESIAGQALLGAGMGMIEPGGKPAEQALENAAGAGVLHLGAKAVNGIAGVAGVGKAVKSATSDAMDEAFSSIAKETIAPPEPKWTTVAVVPPSKTGQFMEALKAAPHETELPVDVPAVQEPTGAGILPKPLTGEPTNGGPLRKKPSAPSAQLVTKDESGELVTKDLNVGPNGTVYSTKVRTGVAAPPEGVSVFVDPNVDPEDLYHQQLIKQFSGKQPGKPLLGRKETGEVFGDEMLSADSPLERMKWENGVVVVGDGEALQLHAIESPAYKRLALRERGLVEVTLPDGSKRMGWASEYGIVKPEPTDFIPNALYEDLPIDRVQKIRRLFKGSDTELNDVIMQSDALKMRAEIEAQQRAAEEAALAQGWKDWREQMSIPAPVADGLPPPPPAPPPPPGMPPMPPAPPPQPPAPPPGAAPLPLAASANWYDAVQKALGNGMNKAKVSILPASSWGPLEAAARSAQAITASSKSFQNSTTRDVFKSFEEEYGLTKLALESRAQFNADVNELVNTKDMRVAQKINDRWAPVAKFNSKRLMETKLAMTSMQAKLQSYGVKVVGNPIADINSADIEQALSDYGTRLFDRYILPEGEYAKLVKKDAAKIEKWTKWVHDNLVDVKGGEYSGLRPEEKRRTAEYILDDILGDTRVRKMDKAGEKAASTAGSWKMSLVQRKELSDGIREILGETKEGLLRMSVSIARAKAAINHAEMWSGVMELGDSVVAGAPAVDNLGRAFVRIERGMMPGFPALEGKYVAPEWWEHLHDSTQVVRSSNDFAHKLSKYFKAGQTVGGLHFAIATQIKGNLQGVLMSGGISNPFGFTKHLAGALGDLRSFQREIGNVTSAGARRFSGARDLLNSFGSLHTSELAATTSFLEKQIRGKYGATLWDVTKSAIETATTGGKLLGKLFDLPDQIAKYMSYRGLLEKAGVDMKNYVIGDLKKAQAFLGPQWGRVLASNDEPLRLIELEAARRISLSFPMLDRTSPALAFMQRNSGVAMNPYVGIQAEQYRCYGMMLQRLMTGEHGYRAHMLKMVAGIGSFYGGLKALQWANGINQKDIDQAWNNEPESVQQFNPGAMALWDKDDRGRPQFMSMTEWFDFLKLGQGSPDFPLWQRVLTNAVTFPVQGNAFDTEIQSALDQFGLPNTYRAAPKKYAWQKSSDQVLADLWSKGLFGPATGVYRAAEIVRKGRVSEEGSFPQPRTTLGQTKANLLGAKIIPGSTPDIKNAEDNWRGREANKGINAAGRQTEGAERRTGLGTVDVEKDINAATEASQSLQDRIEKRNKP